MGGDFIIDKDGVVQYMYCSKKSMDRPSVQDIIDNLKVCSVCLNCNLLFVEFNQLGPKGDYTIVLCIDNALTIYIILCVAID